jgi:hypothetical protein
MAKHTQHEAGHKRGRTVLAASFAVAGLAIAGAGVFAGLNATASNTTAETVSSGTLKLVMANNGVGFGQNITNVAPGDVVNRYVDVTDNGTLDAQNLTLRATDATPTKLTTDATNGLHATVKLCTNATGVVSATWTTAGLCQGVDAATGLIPTNGTITTVVSNVALSALSSAQTLVSGAVTKNSAYHYQVSVTLPDQNETTTNGTLPAGTIQGLSAALTWTFDEAQRAATTTSS